MLHSQTLDRMNVQFKIKLKIATIELIVLEVEMMSCLKLGNMLLSDNWEQAHLKSHKRERRAFASQTRVSGRDLL